MVVALHLLLQLPVAVAAALFAIRLLGVRRLFDPRAVSTTAPTSRKDQLVDVLVRDLPGLRRLPAKVDRIATLAARGELPTVLGYLGLGIAAILILRVVATIVRDG